jgi:hypothetical protein
MSDLAVLMIEPGKKPYMTSIRNNIQEFERIVGGPVDVAKFLRSGFYLVCNINAGFGYQNHQLPNSPCFVVRHENDFISLDHEDANEIKGYLRKKGKKKGFLSTIFK